MTAHRLTCGHQSTAIGKRFSIVLTLLQTLFDIVRLRKGPDAIPHSPVLFAAVAAMWLLAALVMTLTTPELYARDFIIGLLIGAAGLLCYAAVIVLAGKAPRLLQAATALLGCGAIITVTFVAVDVSLSPLLAANTVNLMVTLILLWSVPVEGHIIARTIERHWYVGVMIAMAVFIFQLYLYSVIEPDTATMS